MGELFESEESPSVNDLLISDTVLGEGAEAVSGKIITVHYTGTLMDGTKFDSSLDRGAPFKFILGAGQVIQGWEQGFAGMKVGGKRKLVIPPQLGYGDQAIGSIPANSILVFDVELLDVENQ
ncbi:MAG: FKBP-type peptidyl-prolyl cis-trans isomerase [Candidatus Pacebacteria bacterium]|nr:FKBP-type peptidyl-prolyl cis-trans isomerase [Candidatus Paceibacterota bacterium]